MNVSHSVKFPKIDGIEFFLCGGSVRDLLLGRTPKDKDFVMLTSMSMKEVEAKLNELSKTEDTCIYQSKPEFNTIRCRIQGENVDLAFPRIDETTRRNTELQRFTLRTGSLMIDSKRRDFTINSLYMNEDGEILDFQNGIEDLNNKIIKCVGDPDERMKEDPVRILRAIRFSITLGFDIEENTLFALAWNRNLLCNSYISNDRIKEEINRALKIDPLKTLNLLDKLDIFNILKVKNNKYKIELTDRT